MKITTKKGDKGKTSLFLGGSVFKDDARVELEGTLDELCSFLGLARSMVEKSSLKKGLEGIQKDLFIVGAEAATSAPYLKRLGRRICAEDIERLEQLIEDSERMRRPQERVFCLPGANTISAVLDICRTVARRAERRCVTASKKKLIQNPAILIYLNRLSDLLYLWARACETGL